VRVGRSGAGGLAAEDALRRGDRLEGLTVSNRRRSVPDDDHHTDTVLAQETPSEVVSEIEAVEAGGEYERPGYVHLRIPNLYHAHICRLTDRPDAVDRSFWPVGGGRVGSFGCRHRDRLGHSERRKATRSECSCLLRLRLKRVW
jgi:proline iminopeptidase